MKAELICASIAILAIGCKPKTHPAEALRPQVEEFADRIETDLANGRIGVLDMHFDKAVFVSRVVDDQGWDNFLADNNLLTYKEEYKTNLTQTLTLGGLFLSGIDGSKYFAYDLAKIYRIDDRWHAVFRMYANDAINYHDLLLRIDEKKVWIEDVYIMAVGRELSKIMQESYIAGIPGQDSDTRKQDNLLLMRAKNLLDMEFYEDALATFDSISQTSKDQKALRLFKLQIRANIPNEAYVRELEIFEKDYPSDAGTVLLQIDKNFLYGNYPEVLKSLVQLEKLYGNDPVVDYLHANALNLLGKCAEASPYYETAVNTKPDWQEPFLNWVECRVKSRDYAGATELLTRYQAQYELTPVYVKYLFDKDPNFFLSKSYAAWEASFPGDDMPL